MTVSDGAVPPGKSGLGSLRRKQDSKGKRLRVLSVFAILSALVVAGSIWLGMKASSISEHLEAGANLAPRLKQEILEHNSVEAGETASVLINHTAHARRAASDPLWTMAAALPWVGSNFLAVSTLATAADDVARLAADPLVNVLHTLDWKSLSPTSDGIDLQPLVDAQPKISRAADAVEQSVKRLDAIETSRLIPQIAAPLNEARDELSALQGGLTAANSVTQLAPKMMGISGPREYLVMIQNNAEVRATGGIPGAIAVLSLDDGKLSMGAQASATELGFMSPSIKVEQEQEQIYSARIGKYMQDVNLTPDFPTSASTALSMWEQKRGTLLDGVISVDPVALSYILDGIGPVSLSDSELISSINSGLPTELSGKNVVQTLLSDVYAEIEQPKLQDAYFAGVAQEIFAALSDGQGDAKGLIAGIIRGTEEGRVLVWSNQSTEQSIIEPYALSGSIAGSSISPAQFGAYFNDGTGAKMDYYVKRTVQLVKECAKDGYEQTTVRVTSTNTARADAAMSLPAYVTGGGAFGVPPGSVQTNIVAYGPVQANMETASLDGQRAGFASHRHANRPVGVVDVRLAPGESRTVDFTFGKIVQHAEPNLVVTPTVQAVKDVILPTALAQCG